MCSRECQSELHAWGRENQVQFDPAKESMHVIGRHDAAGPDFKIMGIHFDCKLLMNNAVHETVVTSSWKLRTVMRTRRFFTHAELVLHYKSHILSFIEYRTPGISHACCSVLQPLDDIQGRLLKDLGISVTDALLHFNLAPLQSRRDMAMLGLIHRTVLGKGPEHFKDFFRLATATSDLRTRLGQRRHNRQLIDPRNARFSGQLRRSALGLIMIYNLLPQEVVEAKTVSLFQKLLQGMLKDLASSSVEGWPSLFSPRVPLYRHLLR